MSVCLGLGLLRVVGSKPGEAVGVRSRRLWCAELAPFVFILTDRLWGFSMSALGTLV